MDGILWDFIDDDCCGREWNQGHNASCLLQIVFRLGHLVQECIVYNYIWMNARGLMMSEGA